MANENNQAMKPSLKNSTIYLYGIGEFGYNFVYTFYSYYVMTSLMNYVGVSAAVAAARSRPGRPDDGRIHGLRETAEIYGGPEKDLRSSLPSVHHLRK